MGRCRCLGSNGICAWPITAAAAGQSRLVPVLPLVVVEPLLLEQDDCSARQWAFCAESLEELPPGFGGLAASGGGGSSVVGSAGAGPPSVSVWAGCGSHEETGQQLDYGATAGWAGGRKPASPGGENPARLVVFRRSTQPQRLGHARWELA